MYRSGRGECVVFPAQSVLGREAACEPRGTRHLPLTAITSIALGLALADRCLYNAQVCVALHG